MIIDILTLFPEMFKDVFKTSILGRARDKCLIKINYHNLRKWTTDKHQTVDDTPYGGGAGMILKVDIIDHALHDLKLQIPKNKLQINSNDQKSKSQNQNWKLQNKSTKIVLLTPQGKVFNQKKALQLSKLSKLILICGHYEGFDERVGKLIDEEISIGNYILTGGEIPAMVLVDTITRLIPGVINPESLEHESFSPTENCKLKIENLSYEYPQYTRPKTYKPISIQAKKYLRVPKVLFTGNHAEIIKWREKHRELT